MKTRNVTSDNFIKSALLILVMLIGFSQKGMSQRKQAKSEEVIDMVAATPTNIPTPNYSIKITPLKAFIYQRVNISLESRIYKKLFIVGDAQSWFLDRDPTFSSSENRSINKGARLAIGVYSNSSKKLNSGSFHLGASLFFGNHEIEEKRKSYIKDLVEQSGKIKLLSYGFKVGFGARKTFKNRIFLEAGYDVGYAWNNKNLNRIPLSPSSIDGIERLKEIDLNILISGFFTEPMISIGYSF